jgi:molybdate transport system ATP-binding protein
MTVRQRDVDLTLRVGPGETVAVLGPNGAGKSTMLSVLAGLLRPDSGAAELGGRVLFDLGRSARGRVWVPPHDRGIALLAQEPLLFPHLSVLDNVAFGPRSRGRRRHDARAAARHWLQEVGAVELADRRPAALSGGQAQRVAVARALAAEPELLLLDEPMAALDVTAAPQLRQVLRRVLRGRTAIVVTHDVLDALLLADRVVVIEGGRVAEDGGTQEVLTRPRSAFAARIFGLNMLRGTAQPGGVRTTGGQLVAGFAEEPLTIGAPAVAVFSPAAVAVHGEPPGGSPRNAFRGVVTAVEPRGDRIKVRAGELAAEITPAALAALDLAPGSPVVFVVKATEVALYNV